MAELTPDSIRVEDRTGASVTRPIQRIAWEAGSVELGGYRHYMQKEIFEQSRALADTVRDRLPVGDEPVALELPWTDAELRDIERVVVVACGTSWHAGLVGKFAIEALAGIPVDVDYASEYRYRAPLPADRTLCIAITQSGETADTLAALGNAKQRGAKTLAVCNVMGAQATRQADATLLTHAGPEIGVASTKAFTTQLAVLLLLAMRLGAARGTLDRERNASLVAGLRELPSQIEGLAHLESRIAELALRWAGAESALYLGRGPLYPIALEGALKLKEISYLHAEGYPAGEMKHGPIALIDERLPVLALMPDDEHRPRTLSNLQEAVARDGRLVAFVTRGDRALDSVAEAVFELPRVDPLLCPILYVVPLQLFAYHVAVARDCDVDQPRNLAKSVTVE
jgi:glucosamine--fructose-6-phosphate aminotransferase (isomerizing)